MNKVLPNHLKTPIVKISSDKAINSMSKSSTFPYAFSFTEIIFSPDRSILTSFIKPLLPGIISIMHKNSRKLLFRQFANWPLMYFMFPFYFQSGKKSYYFIRCKNSMIISKIKSFNFPHKTILLGFAFIHSIFTDSISSNDSLSSASIYKI